MMVKPGKKYCGEHAMHDEEYQKQEKGNAI